MLWACNNSGEILTSGKSHKKKPDRLFPKDELENEKGTMISIIKYQIYKLLVLPLTVLD